MNDARPTGTASRTPAAAVAVGGLALVGFLGSVAMSLAHLGLDLPVLGPAALIPPVAVGFALGAALYGVVAVGAFRVRRWAWPLGLAVNGLAFLSAAFPYRGVASAVAMAVSAAVVVVLLSPPGRRALWARG